jgi:iron complex outermembrane recepter protein
MRIRISKLKISPIQSAVLLSIAVTSSAFAQQASSEITIIAEPPLRISGFDGVPQLTLPISVGTINANTLQDIGAQRITDALRLDASVSDSYNLPAYWDKLSVRGYALDNRYNFRREGLPISAETIIPMDNKDRIELLKGTSGIQSGTSAPGGLVNYVVKRAPTQAEKTIRDVTMSYGPGDNRLMAADLGGRFGDNADFGYRFNVAYEDLNPYIRNTQGHRNLMALAMDWRIDANSRLEWEFEQSHHEQIGVNFYSLLGPGTNALPPVVDGTRNITRQPTSQPGVFDGLTGSIRLRHQLENGWLWSTQYGTQHLRADDRLVYASGCETGPSDRFCANGNFRIYDYRSDNERRNSEAIQTDLRGQLSVAGLEHNLKFSLMRHRKLDRMPASHEDNLLGTTNITLGGLTTPTTPNNRIFPNTEISDYNTELAVNDQVRLTQKTTAWLGLRHSQLNRHSVQTDQSGALQDSRGISTPWVALSHQINQRYTLYASYGQGIEVEATPNFNNYTNAGQPLPALRSTQREIGIKSQHKRTIWQATWFDITRPATADAGAACAYNSAANTCTRQIDGQNHHQGLELSTHTKLRQWDFGGSAMWLDAQRENATVQANLNGQHPINVPKYILRGMTEYRYASVPGLRSSLRVSHEATRNVTENGDIVLPAWTTFDGATHYDTKVNNVPSSWTLAIQNLANKHYWRESPHQYGQYFLYPGAPRTLRATVVFHL